jgi:hypothetical protein
MFIVSTVALFILVVNLRQGNAFVDEKTQKLDQFLE